MLMVKVVFQFFFLFLGKHGSILIIEGPSFEKLLEGELVLEYCALEAALLDNVVIQLHKEEQHLVFLPAHLEGHRRHEAQCNKESADRDAAEDEEPSCARVV